MRGPPLDPPPGPPPTLILGSNEVSEAQDYRAPPATASASNITSQRTNNATKNRIPRPANAFILFRADFTKNHTLPDGTERSNGTLSKIASSEWKNLSPEGRGFWYRRADEAKIAHQAKYPEYKFRPVSRKSTERKPKELVAARNDSEKASAAPKEGPPTPATDDRWMQQCSLFSVWHVDGADAKRGRGHPPKGLPPPPEKPKEGGKPSEKPVPTTFQSGSRESAEIEVHERRCAYLEQLHARGVSGEAFKVATQAYDDAHRLKLSRASSSASTVVADALNDDDSESEAEIEDAHRRPLPLPTSPPAPGHAPPRMISPSSSFNRDRLLANEMYAPELLRYTFVMEPAPGSDAQDGEATLAKRDGPSPGFTPSPSQARGTFVRGFEELSDEQMVRNAEPPSMMSSTNKRMRPPQSADGRAQRERTPERDALPVKRPRLE
ncbi:hypothetical protein K523DRAFT_403464 [Schizophyllum commune Tattone D]|nr:hypothetical protein K523DRAFT_403464 [Schizophyllum commune Tattone D]